MASAVGIAGPCGSARCSSSYSSLRGLMRGGGIKRRCGGGGDRVRCVSASYASSSPSPSGLVDQYRTLRIPLGASEKEVKKAFRQLALQYHPDVCKGSNCGVQFHQINQAYDIVMSSLRAPEEEEEAQAADWANDGYEEEQARGVHDSSWDLWEEWMGFEGGCSTGYSSHINPYI